MSYQRSGPLLCLSAIVLASPVNGNEAEDAIAACARVASTGDRILCLENALRQLSQDSTETETTVAEVPAEAPPPEVAPAVVAAGTSVAEGTADSEIGAAQLEARQRRNMSREEVLAELESAENLQVAAYREVPYKRLVVELENGQVWRQINGDTQEIRVNLQRNQTVNISESSLGGYQLRLNEIRRTIRVQRIK